MDGRIDGLNYGSYKQERVHRSTRVWTLYLDLEESLGTLDDIYRDLDAGKGKWKPVETVDEDGDVSRRDPTAEDKREQAAAFLDRAMATRFGSVLKRLMNGLMFVDSKGRNYQFGSREGARQATYNCVRK